MEAQKDEPRKIMMDVYTQWCGPCKMMMRNTFTNADVIAYINANYYVKFDAESPEPIEYQDRTFENPGWRPNARGRNSTHQLASSASELQRWSISTKTQRLLRPFPATKHPGNWSCTSSSSLKNTQAGSNKRNGKSFEIRLLPASSNSHDPFVGFPEIVNRG